MTICVAAMCCEEIDGVVLPFIVGASDRMLTSIGDVEFEPDTPKIVQVAPSIAVMTAGDISIHAEILAGVRLALDMFAQVNPNEWIGVETVAQAYGRLYDMARLRRAENAILTPLGLKADSYLDGRVAPDIAQDLLRQMGEFPDLPVHAIISGVDPSGPHIFVLYDGVVRHEDRVGFAAIGGGVEHASSHLMFMRHTAAKPMPETMFHVFYAKRRAEVVAGIGGATDMFIAGPTFRNFMFLPPELVNTIARGYDGAQKGFNDGLAKGLTFFADPIRASMRDAARTGREEKKGE